MCGGNILLELHVSTNVYYIALSYQSFSLLWMVRRTVRALYDEPERGNASSIVNGRYSGNGNRVCPPCRVANRTKQLVR